MSTSKIPPTDELLLLKMEVEATRQVLVESLTAMIDKIDRLIPEETPKKRNKDWRREVRSWASWKNIKNLTA